MEKQSRVCVTGASGFIGSSLVQKLLEKGYLVHATLRNLGDESKVGLLKGLPGADARLFLFQADINNPGTFRPAIQGCEFVFLVATPLMHDPNSKYKDVIEASLDGIHTIIKFCQQSGTVRRVVYTGSVVATSPMKDDFTGYKNFIDESQWTPIDLPYPHYSEHLKGYTGSKTLSEKEILNYNKGEQGLEIVSLTCALVGGDTIVSRVPDSVHLIVSSLTGIEVYYDTLKFLQALLGSVPLVHIDDVCEAHIFCIEKSVMAGRFLCAVDYPMMKEFVDYFDAKFPDLKPKFKEVEGEGQSVKACSQKLVDLGFKYKFGVEEILTSSVECAKRLGAL